MKVKHPKTGDMPEKNRSQGAWRRHERSRALMRRYRNECAGWLSHPRFVSPDIIDGFCRNQGHADWSHVFADRLKRARKRLDVARPCSCAACGNPRRWFGEIPARERRAASAADMPGGDRKRGPRPNIPVTAAWSIDDE